ncbi:hypothetical protein PV783_33830 [Chitinophaga sp. CC14]|uniref:hypothetical protein n=1 Tax=Chitinophaga sp. CC14 TaxID=3029199 RepID=UPI003B8028C5
MKIIFFLAVLLISFYISYAQETTLSGNHRITGMLNVEGSLVAGGNQPNNTMRVVPRGQNGVNSVTDFFENSDVTRSPYVAMGIATTTWGAPLPGGFIWTNSNGSFPVRDFYFWQGNNPNVAKPAMVIKAGTNAIAMNTTKVPGGYMLAVNGGIIAEKVQIQLFGTWPDYVFSNGYKLPSLQELSSFIAENNHLPGVPSEIEIKDKGINIAEMNGILLKKIEEQALYILQLNERIQKLEEKVL